MVVVKASLRDRVALKSSRVTLPLIFLLTCLSPVSSSVANAQEAVTRDVLASWNDGEARPAILNFVDRVIRTNSPDFVPVEDRIAVFDNDGTLWVEQPNYTQGFFLLDRISALAPTHPEWKTQEPFASVLKGDMKSALSGGEKTIEELLMATHAGMTTEDFE